MAWTDVKSTGQSVTAAEWNALVDHVRGVINVKEAPYGATGNGSTDDTTAIQAAINAAVDPSRFHPFYARPKAVYVPAGDYKITSTLTGLNRVGVTVFGDGMHASRIHWFGGNAPMIQLTNCAYWAFRDIGLWGNTTTANRPTACFRSYSDVSQVSDTSFGGRFNFTRVYCGSTDAGAMTDGIVFDAAASSDQNNDLSYFTDMHVEYPTNSGFAFRHSQSKGHVITNTHCRSPGVAAVNTAKNADGSDFSWFAGGTFSWRGGFIGGAGTACFYVKAPTDAIQVQDTNMEANYRLLLTTNLGGGSAPTGSVTIKANRFASESVASDLEAIVFYGAGPLIVEGNRFDGAAMKIHQSSPAGHAWNRIVGNNFYWTGSSAATIAVQDGSATFHSTKDSNAFLNGSDVPTFVTGW